MNSELDPQAFEYAYESTKIVRTPARFIDTFGLTKFEFLMVTELMDSAGQVRVRSGVVEAQKPQIIKPADYSELAFEGFTSETQKEAEKMLDWLKKKGHDLAFLRYGFEFKKRETKEEIVHETLEQVLGKLKDEADQENTPSLAILSGVDDSWEVGLFKFTLQMIQRSKEVNLTDYKRSGLL